MPDEGEPRRRGLPAWLESLARGDRRAPRPPRIPREQRPRRGRWRRWLLILLVALAALYAAVPYIAIGSARHWLPLPLGGGAAVEDLRTYATDEPVNLALYVRPGRARQLVEQAAPRVWLPPWLLRRGQSASGLAPVDSAEGVMKLSWRLVISGGEPRPTVVLRLTTAQAAALLAPYTDLDFGGARVSCALETATVSFDGRAEGPAPEWRLRVVSRGRLRLEVGGGESDVPVTRLEGLLTVRFAPVAAGWKPEASLALEAIETDATDAPMVSAPATRRQLEGVINVELRRELAKTVLPPWFPTDATVSGEISPEALKP